MSDSGRFVLDMIDARVAIAQTRIMFEKIGLQLKGIGEPNEDVQALALRLFDAELALLRLTEQAREQSVLLFGEAEDFAPSEETIH